MVQPDLIHPPLPTERRRDESISKSLHEGHKIQKAVTIYSKPQGLYEFWRDFKKLKSLFVYVNDIQILDAKTSRWEISGPGGQVLRWTAEIIEDRPWQMISWRTVEPSEVHHSGSLWFLQRGEQTEMRVQLLYKPPGGTLGDWIATLTKKDPGSLILENLRRFKALIETGEIPTIEGQPHFKHH